MKNIKDINSLFPGNKRHGTKTKGLTSQKGFTLVEIIVTLILVGVMAAVGSLGIVQVVKGYVAVKENSTAAQKAQLAMSRMTREIIDMNRLSAAADANKLPITNISQVDNAGNIVGDRTIEFVSAEKAIKINNDVLIDNVESLTFTYYQGSASSSAWPIGQDELLSIVGINMTLANPNLTFTSLVAPRNNGNLGGALPPAAGGSPPAGWGCFVATAVYGDAGHPMVQILRDFRDKRLLKVKAGQWFIKQYYKYGPAMADTIRDRPVAMWVVRCLLAPVVVLSFCLMYAPLAIIFILLLSIIITSAAFSVFRRGFKLSPVVYSSRGSILIGLIVTMVIVAVLAAAMLPMFSSSYMNQIYADQGRKAYYVAESGFRYVAAQFRYASDDNAKNTVLINLNNKKFELLNDAGSFTSVVYPFWFNAAATPSGATSMVTNVSGSLPPEFTGSSFSGYIQALNPTPGFYSYNGFSVSGTSITFTNLSASSPTTGALPATGANVVILPVCKTPTGAAQNLSKGGTLTLSGTGINAFPRWNGNFTLVTSSGAAIKSGAYFKYARRTGSTLYNVTLVNPAQNTAWTAAEAIPAQTNVILGKFIRVVSKGEVGGASRTVTYNVPVGWLAGGGFNKYREHDPMDTGDKWFTGDDSVGGQNFDGKMRVASMAKASDPNLGVFAAFVVAVAQWINNVISGIIGIFIADCGNPDPRMNLIGWNWTKTDVNLAQAWMDARGFLSYDLQVKLETNNQPYYFGGMAFRGRENSSTSYSMYGLSFVKPKREYVNALFNCATCLSTDQFWELIPGEASGALYSGTLEKTGSFPLFTWCRVGSKPRIDYGLPAIVLWQIDASGNFRWLAYKILDTTSGIVTKTGDTWRLNDAASPTLMTRIAEGHSLTFTATTTTPIKYGDVITNSSGARARVIMPPIRSGAWAVGSTGTLVLSGIEGSFAGGGSLYVEGVQRATAGAYNATKTNFIRVYYGRSTQQGTPNSLETDNHRKGNPVGSANWPPDDITEITSDNDYVTLVDWTLNTGVSAMNYNGLTNSVITSSLLVSPAWTPSSTVLNFQYNGKMGDTIALFTANTNGTNISYDDWGGQLDLNIGKGFLMPIQQ